jgi:uncharacterized protein
MTDINNIVNNITITLKKEGVDKIILFGSFACGQPGEESDLDLIIVTSDNYLPSTNREKMDLHHKYNRLIRKFRKLIPIDLLVYTRAMYIRLQESGSIFSREIKQKGKILYESGTYFREALRIKEQTENYLLNIK